MTAPTQSHLCPACKHGELLEASRVKTFAPHGKPVAVELRISRCTACGAELIDADQRGENLRRLQERKSAYGGLLLGEEIVALRKKYGLTQQKAAKIFGKGLIAFSRYETETSYPDASLTKLLKRAIENPSVLKALADEEGVEIPLWQARCSDERAAKLVPLPASPESKLVWARLRSEREPAHPKRFEILPTGVPVHTEKMRLSGTAVNDAFVEEIRVS